MRQLLNQTSRLADREVHELDRPQPATLAEATTKRLREKVRDRTGANRGGTRIEWVIEDLNPILRGWGNYFRTGNAVCGKTARTD